MKVEIQKLFSDCSYVSKESVVIFFLSICLEVRSLILGLNAYCGPASDLFFTATNFK